MRKWFVIIFIIVVAAVGGYFLFVRRQSQQETRILESLQTVKAERGILTTTIGGTGAVETDQTAVLTWQTSGVVDQINTAIGELVKGDQVLANLKHTSLPQNVILAQADLANAQKSLEELYDTDLALIQAEQAVVKARDAVRKAEERVNGLGKGGSQASVDSAEATVLLAKIKLDNAWEDYKPYENKPESNPVRAVLFNKFAQAQQEYDLAVSRLNNLQGRPSDLTFELAQSDLDVAQANLEDANRLYDELKAGPDKRDIEAIQARIAAAQAALDTVRLTAPFDGKIMEVHIKPGDRVSPGTTAFRLDDLNRLLVIVPISEVDVGQVALGQDTVLTFDAIPDKVFMGEVSEVAQVGLVNQGVVDFNVTIELVGLEDASMDESDETGLEYVKPGMTAAVNIIAEKLDNVLLVPNRAVRVVDGQRVVYVLVDGIPRPVEITLGASSETDSEVLTGDLSVGDEIVLNPPLQFEFGQEPSFMRNMRGFGQ